MNLANLEALAKAATSRYGEALNRDDYTDLMNHINRFKNAANPETILALIALIKQQHEALYIAKMKSSYIDPKYGLPHINAAIAAYEQMMKGE